MKPLITFATLIEANALLKEVKAFCLIENELYSSDFGSIVITSMGSLNAAIKVSKHLKENQEVWNFGACGALNDFEIFSVVPIKAVSKGIQMPITIDEHSKSFYHSLFKEITLQERGKSCLTSDFPIHDEDLKNQLKICHDVVDMEAYGIAMAAEKVKIWKCVSDFASKNGQKLIIENLHQVSHCLKDTFFNEYYKR
jgi:hypothetical protein